MTGRELILYILENGLEDEPIFNDGKLIGFITAGEAAAKMNVGVATIYVWASLGKLNGVVVNGTLLIPMDTNFAAIRNESKLHG